MLLRTPFQACLSLGPTREEVFKTSRTTDCQSRQTVAKTKRMQSPRGAGLVKCQIEINFNEMRTKWIKPQKWKFDRSLVEKSALCIKRSRNTPQACATLNW